MRFASVVAFAIAAVPTVLGGVIAENALDKRILGSEIADSVKRVNTSVLALDAQVTKVNSGDVNQFLPVNTAAQDLASVISKETTYVNSQEAVDLFGALNVQLSVGDLITSVQKLSKDLISIKKYADAAGVTSVVLQQVQSQKTSSGAYADAVAHKTPNETSFIGDLDKQQVDTALQNVIDAYSS